MPPSTEGGEGRHVQPNMSDSTLSTVGGMGLEELAAFVRGSSLKGWEDQQQQERRHDNGDGDCQNDRQPPLQPNTMCSPSLPLVNTSEPLSGPTALPFRHDCVGSSVQETRSPTRKRSAVTSRADGQSYAHERPALSPTKSIAELVVRTVTESVLQRSASTTCSVFRTSTDNHKTRTGPTMSGKDAGVVKDGVPATTLTAEEQVTAQNPLVLLDTETAAKLKVREVTTLGLQRSTRNILKAGREDVLALVTSNAQESAARSGVEHGAGNSKNPLHTRNDATLVEAQRDTPTPRSMELLVGEKEVYVEQRAKAAALKRASTDGAAQQRPLSTYHTRKPQSDIAGSRADGERHSAYEQGDEVGRQEIPAEKAKATVYVGSSRDGESETDKKCTRDVFVAMQDDARKDAGGTRIEDGRTAETSNHEEVFSSEIVEQQDVSMKNTISDSPTESSSDDDNARETWRSKRGTANAITSAFCSPSLHGIPAPLGNPVGDNVEKAPARHGRYGRENRKGAGESRSVEVEPQLHRDQPGRPALYTSRGHSKERGSRSPSRGLDRLGSHREAVKPSRTESPAPLEATSSRNIKNRSPHKGEGGRTVSVATSIAGGDSFQGATGPTGAVVGLAGLHRDVASWFNGEVLVPSAARAVAYVSNNGGARPAEAQSSSVHCARPAAATLGEASGSANTLSGEIHHIGNEASYPSSSYKDENVDRRSHDDGADTSEGEPPRQTFIGQERRAFHPAQLFHLLWQRNRYRCPFSCCPIPDTVVFDSMGEAVDWFFTSKREGGIKRKLTSNTRLSNIFREFSKGSGEEGDPVAVLVFWTPKTEGSDALGATRGGTEGAVAVSGGKRYGRRDIDPERQNRSHEHNGRHHRRQPHQQGTAFRHLTARELHGFLFGDDHGHHALPTGATCHSTAAAAADGRKRQQTDPVFDTKTTVNDYNETRPGLGNGVRTLAGDYTGVEFTRPHMERSGTRHSERSKAAARAAGAETGGGSGGGWCLLQRFIEPAGTRVSTLRCDWTLSPSQRPPHANKSAAAHVAASTNPAQGYGSRPRWGSVQEVETSFRERSPARSPFRERLLDDSEILSPEYHGDCLPASFQPVEGTTGRERRVPERIATSEGVSEGCMLQRSTNIFRADRRDLTCEDRCVTFEEPTPSSRGGLWPRSVKDPVRSSPLKQTLVEACSAVSDHVSQVTKGVFRVKSATIFFRQGADGRTFMMFLSTWGESPAIGVDQSEPLLARAGTFTSGVATNDEHQARWQDTIGLGSEKGHRPSVEERTRLPPELAAEAGAGGGKGELQYQAVAHSFGLVCPGCGCSGVRGGVRRSDREVDDREKASRLSTTTQRGGSEVPEGNESNAASELPQGSKGSCGTVRKAPPWPQPSSGGASAPKAPTAVNGTFRTSLGVIVDVCTTCCRLADSCQTKLAHRDNTTSPRNTARVPTGVARCLRVPSRIYPGVSAETIADRCNEDPRLRLRGVSVCRGCAVEISGASDARLQLLEDVFRRKINELAGRLGTMSGETILSASQRKARALEDIKAFRHRLTSASSASCGARTYRHRCFGGGPSRMGESPLNQSGHLANRPLGFKCVRPRTTDGISPRQQYDHSSRRIVSATTPSSGLDCSSGPHGEVRSAVKVPQSDNTRGGKNKAPEGNNLFRLSTATENTSGSDGVGGDGDLSKFSDGFALRATESVGAKSRNHARVFPDGHGRYTAASPNDRRQQHQQHQQHQLPHHYHDEKGSEVLDERSFYTPAKKAFRCRRLCDTYGGTTRREHGERGTSPGRDKTGRPSQSATPVRESLQRHQRPASRLSRGPRSDQKSRSSRTGRCGRGGGHRRYSSSAESPSTSSSKALQWAKTVSAKTVERRCSAPLPMSSYCPPRQYLSDGLEGGDDDTRADGADGVGGETGARSRSAVNRGEEEEENATHGRNCGRRNRVASNGGGQDSGESHGTWADSSAGGGRCVSEVNAYSGAVATFGAHVGGYVGDSYSDASFAGDDESEDKFSRAGEGGGDSPKTLEFSGYAVNDEVTVDAIPSMLVETGK